MACGSGCWGTWEAMEEGRRITRVGRTCDHPQGDPEEVVVCFVLVAVAGNGWTALTEYREDFCHGGAQMFPGGKPKGRAVGEAWMTESYEEALKREMGEELGRHPERYRRLPDVLSGEYRCVSFLVEDWTPMGEPLPRETLDRGDPLSWRLLTEQAGDDRWPASAEIARHALGALGPPPIDETNEHLTYREQARLTATDEPEHEPFDNRYEEGF